ncbi:MAG: hypothetical protein JSS32_06105, partial [Verrucomicrobia bacterium]|nr:hypothetical protein [Verrucomicrobiota bacterium]
MSMQTSEIGERHRVRIRGFSSTTWSRPRRVAGPRQELSRPTRIAFGVSGIVLVLALWQIAASAGLLDPLVASSPSKIFTAARRLISEDILGPAILSTAKLFGVGFGVSLVSGLAIG